MWETWQLIMTALLSLIVGVVLTFFFTRWYFSKQLNEIEKNYRESVKKNYREMGNFFGRKMSEEDLNKITAQLEEKTASKSNKTSPKKIKPKPKRKK